MLPPQVSVVPLYVMWAKLAPGRDACAADHSRTGLGDAFSIFLLRQFFMTIPEEYLDAARLDGCASCGS
jgi:multiple sugar transport system permease protein